MEKPHIETLLEKRVCSHCGHDIGDLYKFNKLQLSVTVDLRDIDSAIELFQSNIRYLERWKNSIKDAAEK